MLALIAFIIFLILIFSEKLFGRPRLYPPGPKPLPLLGNLLSVAFHLRSLKHHHAIWRYWTKIYGNILGLRLGVVNVVIVSGKDLIKEVSSKEVFEGRPDGFFYVMRSFGKKLGIVFNDGSSWIKTRKIVLKYLKNFGYNQRCMENYISEECKALVNMIMKEKQPILVNKIFHITIVNILWRLVAGKRYNLDDEKLKVLCDLISRLFRAVDMSGGVLNLMPFVRHLAPDLSGYNELRAIHNLIHNFLKETIEDHERNLDVNNPKDVIDAFLIEKLEGNSQSCPKPLPLLGNLLSVAFHLRSLKHHHAIWRYWTKIYGNILGLRLGVVNVVIVSGKDLIKEVSSKEVFEGRPDGFFYVMRSFGKKLGIVFNDGSSWIKTRKIVLKYLKNFGYNQRCMENYISEECKALVNMIMKEKQPILVNKIFHITIVNILWRLVAGKRYNLDDEKLKVLCDLISRLFRAVDMSGGVLNLMPFVRHLAPDLSGYNELRAIHNLIHNFLKETIEDHERNLDVNNPKDVIDAFLIEKLEGNSQSFTDEELQVVCLDLLEAGMETVSNTAVFMLLHIVRNDDVQKQLHQEIDDIIGPSRTPNLADRARMVYTEAVLLETLRISSVAAVGIPHMALEDAPLGNYIIPKGTFVLLAMYDLHNGNHWKDPQIFRPDRFITKEGNLIQDDWLMPFGHGRRRCVGEGLARSELFMFLTHLLQKFQLKIPEGDPIPTTEPNEGLSLSAKLFKIVFELRK